MNIRHLFAVPKNSFVNDLGLLVIRVLAGTPLFLIHGWEKLTDFSRVSQFQMDPIHIGVYPTLVFAALADGICSILVILGLATRPASLVITVCLGVVVAVRGNVAPAPPPRGHLELTFLYWTCFLAILIAGPGRFSIDRWLLTKTSEKTFGAN